MPSPFPGMDPYLEAQGLWEGFHAMLVSCCAESLNRDLPDSYVAQVETRVSLGTGSQVLLGLVQYLQGLVGVIGAQEDRGQGAAVTNGPGTGLDRRFQNFSGLIGFSLGAGELGTEQRQIFRCVLSHPGGFKEPLLGFLPAALTLRQPRVLEDEQPDQVEPRSWSRIHNLEVHGDRFIEPTCSLQLFCEQRPGHRGCIPFRGDLEGHDQPIAPGASPPVAVGQHQVDSRGDGPVRGKKGPRTLQ